MALTPKNASDSLIERLFDNELKPAEALAAAFNRLDEVMHKPPEPEPTKVAELFFHTNKRRDMQFDPIPVGHDTGFRCYDGTKHDSESAFQSGEFGDGLSEEQAYVEWLHNTDALPRRSRMVGLGNPEQPPDDIPDEDVFEYDDRE